MRIWKGRGPRSSYNSNSERSHSAGSLSHRLTFYLSHSSSLSNFSFSALHCIALRCSFSFHFIPLSPFFCFVRCDPFSSFHTFQSHGPSSPTSSPYSSHSPSLSASHPFLSPLGFRRETATSHSPSHFASTLSILQFSTLCVSITPLFLYFITIVSSSLSIINQVFFYARISSFRFFFSFFLDLLISVFLNVSLGLIAIDF